MKTEATGPAAARRRRVVETAIAEGLLVGDNSRLGVRIHRRLIIRTKEWSGITSTTDLIEYALAKVALEDDFGAKLLSRKGSIPVDVKLGI